MCMITETEMGCHNPWSKIVVALQTSRAAVPALTHRFKYTYIRFVSRQTKDGCDNKLDFILSNYICQ